MQIPVDAVVMHTTGAGFIFSRPGKKRNTLLTQCGPKYDAICYTPAVPLVIQMRPEQHFSFCSNFGH
jgi:hypothetical protein